MTYADLVELIRQDLGYNQSLSELIITRNVDNAQLSIEKGEGNFTPPWWNFDADYNQAVAANATSAPLPDRFVDFHAQWPLKIVTSGNVVTVLKGFTDKALSEERQGTGFSFDGESIWLKPVPSEAVTLYIPHFAYTADASLASVDSSSRWLAEFPNLLRAHAVYNLSFGLRDTQARNEAMGLLEQQMSDYMKRNISRMESYLHQKMEVYY